MWQRFTERTRRVIFFAQEEAIAIGASHVTPLYFLIGIIRESDSVAGRVLAGLGVDLNRLRSELNGMRVGHSGMGRRAEMQLDGDAKWVIDEAYVAARELGTDYIGTEHLLLGLMRDAMMVRVLSAYGADREVVRLKVLELYESETELPPPAAPPAEVVRQRWLWGRRAGRKEHGNSRHESG